MIRGHVCCPFIHDSSFIHSFLQPHSALPPPPLQLFAAEKHFYRCIWQYRWCRRLQGAHFLPSTDDSRTSYERSTMKHVGRLKNCLVMHCRKSISDTLDTVQKIACANEQCNWGTAFWKIWVGVCLWLSRIWAPQKKKRRRLRTASKCKNVPIKWWWKQNIHLATWNIEIPTIFKIWSLANNGAVWAQFRVIVKAWIALFCKGKIMFKRVLYVDDQTILQ